MFFFLASSKCHCYENCYFAETVLFLLHDPSTLDYNFLGYDTLKLSLVLSFVLKQRFDIVIKVYSLTWLDKHQHCSQTTLHLVLEAEDLRTVTSYFKVVYIPTTIFIVSFQVLDSKRLLSISNYVRETSIASNTKIARACPIE